MTIENSILGFIFLCACFVIVNICIFPYRTNLKNAQEKKVRLLRDEMQALLNSHASMPDEKWEISCFNQLGKRIRHLPMLMAYEEMTLTELPALKPEDLKWYIQNVTNELGGLCRFYEKKPVITKTCFIHVMGRLLAYRAEPPLEVWQFLYMNLRSESLVCRQNALSTLCSAGQVDQTVKAIQSLNRTYQQYNSKLITESLLRFSGSKEELADGLWAVYPQMGNDFKLAILNALRLMTDRYGKQMLALLQDSRVNSELHYAAIRYLGRYPYAQAKPMLLELVDNQTRNDWTYAAVSAQALASYPGQDTFDTLKKALFRPDWYVRLNASASLQKLGIDYMNLSDVINSSDRYAREIVQYRLEEARRTVA